MVDVKVRTDETNGKAPQKCGEPTECFSRVTGYYRPVANWNKGKQEEFKERKKFNVKGESNAFRLG